MNVYVDDTPGKALVAGNVDDISGLDFLEINCTEGLELLSTGHNGSIVLDVQGFGLTDPAVSFNYTAA